MGRDVVSDVVSDVVNEERTPPASFEVGEEARPTASSQFGTELAAVEQEVAAALADLNPPFSRLVHNQLKRVRPLLRAGVVLATAAPVPDDATRAARRIYLAAAVEMLYLALRIHTRLLNTPAGSDPDRSLLGSTILAGDYCFSRAASLAVRTENAVVVDIFAKALKRASEGHLRQLLEPDAMVFDENGELLVSGALAAGELAALGADVRAANVRQSEQLAGWLEKRAAREVALPDEVPAPAFLTEGLTAEQSRRWQQVYRLAQMFDG